MPSTPITIEPLNIGAVQRLYTELMDIETTSITIEPAPPPAVLPNPETDGDGTRRWHNHLGQFHRIDGPAIESPNGDREWWVEGKRHRDDDLPAVEGSDGYKEWRQNGHLHRLTGPAVEFVDGTQRMVPKWDATSYRCSGH